MSCVHMLKIELYIAISLRKNTIVSVPVVRGTTASEAILKSQRRCVTN